MKRIGIIVICLLIGHSLFAQNAIESLINTERRFAKLASDKNVKEAFLFNLDSEGVVFSEGKIVNGIKAYQKQQVTKSRILWEPAFSIISSSGDLGINTGPYQYFANDTAIKPIVQGHFSTVWHLTKNGEWKFLADMGIDYSATVELPVNHVDKKVLPINHSNKKLVSKEEVLLAEQSFIKEYTSNGSKAFLAMISDDAWFNVEGITPLIGRAAITQKLAFIPSNIIFTAVGYGISKAGDLGYVYGMVDFDNKKENYLRVWQHKNNHWILIFQTLLF